MKKNLFNHVFGTEFCGLVYLLLGKQTHLKQSLYQLRLYCDRNLHSNRLKEGEKVYWLCKLDQDRCGFGSGSTQGFNNVRTQFLLFLAQLPPCWLYSPALPEQKITLIPSAPESLQGHLYLERLTLFFLEAPAKVSLHLIGSDWPTLFVATGM